MKRIFKKAISVFLVVTMLLCAAPLNGFVGIQLPNFSSIFATKVGAADSGYGSVLASGSHGSKVTYVYYEDGTLIVSGSGSMRNDRISTAGQYNTNSRRWGGYEHQIKRVIINEGVTSIGDFAFYYCENLESVSMPSTITYIGSDAFHFCKKITSIQIPPNVKTIGQYSFGQMNLSSLVIPASVETILWRAFYANYNLKTVVFQKGAKVKSLGSYCFNNTAISKIMIPKTVTSIDSYAFSQCKYLTDVFYPGTQSEWKKISISSGNEKLTNSTMHYNSTYYAEELGVFYNYDTYNNEIKVNVKAVDEKNGELVAVDGATVEIKVNGNVIATKKTNSEGVAIFTKENFSRFGQDVNSIVLCGMVTAYKNIGNEVYITNFDDYLRGNFNCDIILDNLQFRPTLSVAYNKNAVSLDEVKNILDAYIDAFYKLTRGSILVNISNIKAKDSDKSVKNSFCDILIGDKFTNQANTNGYNSFGNNHIYIGINNDNGGFTCNVLCHESLHYLIDARDEYCCTSKYTDNKNLYAIDFNENGIIEEYIYHLYWAESEEYVLPKSYKFNSNEYLSLKWDDYRFELLGYNIDIGDISNRNGNLYWINSKDYTYDYFTDEESDELIYSRILLLEGVNELKLTYWGDLYSRPSDFGIMDDNSLYLSSYSDYSYLDDIENKTVHSYTPQWYYNHMPVENHLEEFIRSKATSNKYEASVLLSAMEISHYEPQLNNEYTCEEVIDDITADGNSALLATAVLNTSPICFASFDKVANGTTFYFSSSDLNNIILLVKYKDNPTYERFDVVFENCTATVEISDENGVIDCIYTLSQEKEGMYTYNQYISESFGAATSNGSHPSTVMTVSTASDNSNNLIIYSDKNKYENDEYFSVADTFYAVKLKDTEISDTFNQTVSYNSEIDFTSITAFLYDGENYSGIETYVGVGENNCAYVSFPYSGEGKYILMAKAPSEKVYQAPTNLLIDDVNSTYDKEIHVSFEELNDINDVATYNLYYSKSKITNANIDGVTCVSLKPGNDSYTLYLNDEYDGYYFYVEVIGKDGGKSPLSEANYFSLAPYDSDSDGIPDYWLKWYPSLAELEDISGTDSDGDELTNFQEYQNGTNPLNPDTDGDNVYDSVEPWYNLNPLEPKTDGVTDDYTIVYGMPDVSINVSEFDISETDLTCLIENNTEGKAIRTSIYLYVCDELVDARVVNIDSNSSVEYTFSKEYLVDGMKIVIDKDKITRDSDYSNNEFAYSPVTGISTAVSNLTLLKSAREQLEFTCYPADSSDFLKWKSNNEKVITVDNYGNITCKSIGTAIVTVTTSLGYSCSYDILVEPFKGAGLTDFDCQLINDDSQVQIIGYVGDETSIVIPQSIGNIDVISLSEKAFLNQSNLSAVSIHSGIVSIGEDAFAGCSNLTDVYYDSSRYRFNQIDFGTGNDILFNADIHCAVIPTTAKNNAVLDDASGLIYGMTPGIDSINDYTQIELDGYYWEYTPTQNGFGTGSLALLTNGEDIIDGYTVVIFGDVNGDGWYDGEDAFIVNLIVHCYINIYDLGEAIWTAADCNHDGEFDDADVELLTNAGLLLNKINQSKPKDIDDEFELMSDYIEYVMLIDQSAGMNPGVNPDVDDMQQGTTDTNTTPENPADEIDIEAILTNIFEFFKKLFTLVFSFVIK